MAANPWKIHVDQHRIDELRQKLELATLPDEIEDAGWTRGPPLADIKRLVTAWKKHDWRTAEDEINAHENFITPIAIDGFGNLDIHFIHKRSVREDAIPLLFIHGWPGSFIEVLKLKSLLSAQDSDPSTPSFHLVAPSLPNFGFSSGVRQSGFGLKQYAETLHKLMLLLGYPSYATQSGDWGYWIARSLGHTYPSAVLASHYNMAMCQPPTLLSQPLLYLRNLLTPRTVAERHAAERTAWFRAHAQAYNRLQSTRPQSLAYSLRDSPVGLLAWIYERLVQWSDGYEWTDDELLMWIGVYWFSTAGPGKAGEIYWEVANEMEGPQSPDGWTDGTGAKNEGRKGQWEYTYEGMMRWMKGGVKLGITYSPMELEAFPRLWGRTLGNVVYEVENEQGGHFYAHEHPQLLVRDLNSMFGKKIKAFER